MDKDRVLELAAMAKSYWEADCLQSSSTAADCFVMATQMALSETAEKEGYSKAFDKTIDWLPKECPEPDFELAIDWEEARKIAEALEQEDRGRKEPWGSLYVEGTLCYAHQTVHEGNLDLFVEHWDGRMEEVPKWRWLTKEQQVTLILRSARKHFIADLDLTADDFTERMDPSVSDGADRFLDPIPTLN